MIPTARYIITSNDMCLRVACALAARGMADPAGDRDVPATQQPAPQADVPSRLQDSDHREGE